MTMIDQPDEPVTVFLVTAGDYSDYMIIDVFLDREDAEVRRDDYDKEHNGYGYPQIEEFKVRPTSIRKPWKKWFCHIQHDGTITDQRHYEWGNWNEAAKPSAKTWVADPYYSDRRAGVTEPHVVVQVSGPVEWADKVFSERKARALAELDVLIAKHKSTKRGWP